MSDTTSPRIYDFRHEQHDIFDMMENCQYCEQNASTVDLIALDLQTSGANMLTFMSLGTVNSQPAPFHDLVGIQYPDGMPPGITANLQTGEISGIPTISPDQTEVETYSINLQFRKGDNSIYKVPVILKVHPDDDIDTHLDTPEGELIMQGMLREIIKNSNQMYAGNGLANKASSDVTLYVGEGLLYLLDLWGFGLLGRAARGGAWIGRLSARSYGGMHKLAVEPGRYAKLAAIPGKIASKVTLGTINKRLNMILKDHAWYRIWELHRLTTLVRDNILPKYAGRLSFVRVPADKSKPLQYFKLFHGRMRDGVPAYQSERIGWFFKLKGISDNMLDDIIKHYGLKGNQQPTLYQALKFALVNPEAKILGKGLGPHMYAKAGPLDISFVRGAKDSVPAELVERMDEVLANLLKQVDDTSNWTVKTKKGKTTRIRLGGETTKPYTNLEHFKLETALSPADAARALRHLDEWLHSCGAKFTDKLTNADLARALAVTSAGVTGISVTGKVIRETVESAEEAATWAFKNKGGSVGRWLALSAKGDVRQGTYIIYTFAKEMLTFSFLKSRKTLESNLKKKYAKLRDLIDDAGGVKNADEFTTLFPELSLLDAGARMELRAEVIRRLELIDNMVANASVSPIIARSAADFGKTLDETLPHIELKYADLDGTGEATYYIVRSGRAGAKDANGAVVDDFYKLSKLDIELLHSVTPSLPNRAVSTIDNNDILHKFACICDQQLNGVYGYGDATGKILLDRGVRDGGRYANGQTLLDTASDSLMVTEGGGRLSFGAAANRETARAILNELAPAYKQLDELVLGIAKHNLDDIAAKMDASWIGARVHQAWCKTVLKRRIIRQFGASRDDQVRSITIALNPKNEEHTHLIQWIKENVPPGGPIQVLDPVTGQMTTVGTRSLEGMSTLPANLMSDIKFQSLIREAAAVDPLNSGARVFTKLGDNSSDLSLELHARILKLTEDSHLADDVIEHILKKRGNRIPTGTRPSGQLIIAGSDSRYVDGVTTILRDGLILRRSGASGAKDDFITLHVQTGAGPNVNYIPVGFFPNSGATRAMMWEVQNARREVLAIDRHLWKDADGNTLGFFDGGNNWIHHTEESRKLYQATLERYLKSHYGDEHITKLISPEFDRILIRPGTELIEGSGRTRIGGQAGRGGPDGRQYQTYEAYLEDGVSYAKQDFEIAYKNWQLAKETQTVEQLQVLEEAQKTLRIRLKREEGKLASYREQNRAFYRENGVNRKENVDAIVGMRAMGDEVDGTFVQKLKRMDEIGVESQVVLRKFETRIPRQKHGESKLMDGDAADLARDADGVKIVNDTAVHVEVEATLTNGEKIKYLMYQSSGEGTGASSKGHWYPTPGYDKNFMWMVKNGGHRYDDAGNYLGVWTPKVKHLIDEHTGVETTILNEGWCYGSQSAQEMAEFLSKWSDDLFPVSKLPDNFDPKLAYYSNGFGPTGVLKPISSIKDEQEKAVQAFITAVKGRTMSAGDTDSAGIVAAFNALTTDLANIDRAAIHAIQRVGAHLQVAKLAKAGDDVVSTPGVATLRESPLHVLHKNGTVLPVGTGVHSAGGAYNQAADYAALMAHLDEGDQALLKYAQQVDALYNEMNAPVIAELLMKKAAIKKSRSLQNGGSPPLGNTVGVHTQRGPGAFNKYWHMTSKSVLRMGAHARNAFGGDAALGALVGVVCGIATKGTWQTMKEMKENLTSEDVKNMISTNWMQSQLGQAATGKVNQIFLRYEKDNFVFDGAANLMDGSWFNTNYKIDGYFDYGATGRIDVCMTRKIEGWTGRTTNETPAADGTGFPSGGHPVLMSFHVDEEHIVTGFELMPGISPNPLQEYLDSLNPAENRLGCHSAVQAKKYWEDGPNKKHRRNSWIQHCRDGDTFANMDLGRKVESDENGLPVNIFDHKTIHTSYFTGKARLSNMGNINGDYYYVPGDHYLGADNADNSPQPHRPSALQGKDDAAYYWYYIDAEGNKQWMQSSSLPDGYGNWSL